MLAGAALLALPLLAIRSRAPREEAFAFADIPGAPGFRRLDAGAVSTPSGDPFVGLREPGAPPPPQPLPAAALCAALFGSPPPEPCRSPPSPTTTVPIAAISPSVSPPVRTPDCTSSGTSFRSSATRPRPPPAPRSPPTCRARIRPSRRGSCARPSSRRRPISPTSPARSGLDPARLIADARGDTVARRLATIRARRSHARHRRNARTRRGPDARFSARSPTTRLDALLARERAAWPAPLLTAVRQSPPGFFWREILRGAAAGGGGRAPPQACQAARTGSRGWPSAPRVA
jgi:hypothetical protein